MYKNKKVVVVLPAYNAEKTLEKTFIEIPMNLVDEVILVDDNSIDETYALAKKLGIHHVIRHENNKGYGGNQKTCYNKCKELNADIVVMLHPDYQYTPLLIDAMVSIIGNDLYPVVFGSRILGKGALRGGMPLYKYFFNRLLTFFQNTLMNQKLSEYHTGFRSFDMKVLNAVNYEKCSDDFAFDNQIVAQICNLDFEIGEVTCPTKYFPEASSINFKRSSIYGLHVILVSIRYFLHKTKIVKWDLLA
ncbi:glycosyltransferase family 2 protein [Flavobacterium sp.]|uniref:glycosyltransferase family 2 protein n=1 Tax=Flavobacterium sp. TaxID=239 RepID=UPI003797AA1E